MRQESLCYSDRSEHVGVELPLHLGYAKAARRWVRSDDRPSYVGNQDPGKYPGSGVDSFHTASQDMHLNSL